MLVYNINDLPEEMVTAATTIRAAKEGVLRAAFDKALNSNIFMSFPDKVESLLDAMSIPISDDKSYNQFYIHSTKDLNGEAAIKAAGNQEVPVLPTIEQIHAEARKRYDEKAADEERKAARKAAKAAKSTPVTPIPTQAA